MPSLSTYIVPNAVTVVPTTGVTPFDAVVNTAPPAGIYDGYAFVKAPTDNGLTIQCKTSHMRIAKGSRKVVFWGIRFDGWVDIEGDDIVFYYGEGTYSGVNLSGFPQSFQSPGDWYDEPSCFSWRDNGTNRCKVLGTRIHNVATAFNLQGNQNFYGAGVYTHDHYISDDQPTGKDRWHSDCVADSNGKNTSFTFEDYTFAPRRTGGSANGMTPPSPPAGYSAIACTMLAKINGGNITGTFNNGWIAGPLNYSWQLTATLGNVVLNVNKVAAKEYPNNTALANADHYHWGSKSGAGPILNNGGSGGHTVTVNTQNVHDFAPPSVNIGVNDPATLWRQKWGYDDCLAWFGFDTVTHNPPSAPRSVTATALNASARVDWQAPTSAGTGAINDYRITATPDGIVAHAGGSARNAVVPGLTNGTAYTFTVAARNNDVATYSPESAPSNSVTPVTTTTPGAPTILGVSAGDQKVGIIWQTPANNGGAPITAYEVTSTPTIPAPNTVQTYSAVTNGSGGYFTGLTNGTTYTVKVRARNSQGVGPYSANSASFIPSGIIIPGLGRFDAVNLSPFFGR